MPVFICVWKHKESVAFIYKFRARNNHCGTITQNIGTSATSLLPCMNDVIEP